MAKSALGFTLRAGCSIALLAVLLRNADVSELWRLGAAVATPQLALALAGLVLDRIIMAYRWLLLLGANSVSVSAWQLTRVYFVSGFLGMFLPSGVAVDALRVYQARTYAATQHLLSSVLVDRVVGVLALALVALGGVWALAFVGGMALDARIGWSAAALITATVGAALAFERLPLERARGWLGGLGRAGRSALEFHASLARYRDSKAALGAVLVIAMAQNLLYAVVLYLVCAALGVSISPLYMMVVGPIIGLLGVLPISLGGIGVQEGALVYFLGRAGVAPGAALTAAVVFRALTILTVLPGGFLLLRRGGRVAGAVGSADRPG